MPTLVSTPRLRVALHRRRLDAALAGGADPAGDPALTLRAQQLLERKTRRGVANILLNLLDAADEPPGAWRCGDPRPALQRDAVLAARPDLEELAERLTQTDPVAPRAVALAAQLAWDPASPVYARTSATGVADFARATLRLLAPPLQEPVQSRAARVVR